VTGKGVSKSYDARIHRDELDLSFEADWLDIQGSQSRSLNDSGVAEVDWQIISRRPMYQFAVQFHSDTLSAKVLNTDLQYTERNGRVRFRWFSEPSDTLHLKAAFELPASANLIRTVTASYPELPVPLQIEAEQANVIYSTQMTRRDTFHLAYGMAPQ